MKTKWILQFFFLYKFSIIATGWENCTIAWQILCQLEGITPLFLRSNYVCSHTFETGLGCRFSSRNYFALPDAVQSFFYYISPFAVCSRDI